MLPDLARQERLAKYKHSSLFGFLVTDEEKKGCDVDTRSLVLVAASAEAGRPVAYPDQASLEQYGTKTWLASEK
jgi:hypothetical protein